MCESQACRADRQGHGSGLREPGAAWSKKLGKTWGMLVPKRAEQHLQRALAAPGWQEAHYTACLAPCSSASTWGQHFVSCRL